MADTITFNNISKIHEALGLPKPKHPLITLVKYSDVTSDTAFRDFKVSMNLYQIGFKRDGCGKLRYGRSSYDYQEGTLIFIAPNQVMEYESDELLENDPLGWTLGFHPDLIRKSDLGKKMDQYSFFDYDVNEALHLSNDEIMTIEGILEKVVKEYSQNLDRHSQHLIISNIQLLLDYCQRFYDRQFYTRTNINSGFISKFEQLLKSYYKSELVSELGIPSVSYCAKELNISPNYLSDLLKKETGKTAHEHIHLYIIEKAKTRLLNSDYSVSEIGYQLGFVYPQHFSNLFKSKTGVSPSTYRNDVN